MYKLVVTLEIIHLERMAEQLARLCSVSVVIDRQRDRIEETPIFSPAAGRF